MRGGEGACLRIEGKGFTPGDDVRIRFAGEGPFFLRADAAGRVRGSAGGVAGFLPGDRPSIVTVLGNSASGEGVYIELPMCGRIVEGPEKDLG
jgi:NADPH:quinone reductase-like Zn-dependent oxidoreductase